HARLAAHADAALAALEPRRRLCLGARLTRCRVDFTEAETSVIVVSWLPGCLTTGDLHESSAASTGRRSSSPASRRHLPWGLLVAVLTLHCRRGRRLARLAYPSPGCGPSVLVSRVAGRCGLSCLATFAAP